MDKQDPIGSIIYLSLGSNLGDRHDYLIQAGESLKNLITNWVFSSIIESRPQYVVDQPYFLNQVVKGFCVIEPFDLLKQLKNIEQTIGRKPTISKGPRKIDIDIISYGDIIIDDSILTLPHPGLCERLFVLEPLAQIEPNWICPKTGKTVKELLKDLDV